MKKAFLQREARQKKSVHMWQARQSQTSEWDRRNYSVEGGQTQDISSNREGGDSRPQDNKAPVG